MLRERAKWPSAAGRVNKTEKEIVGPNDMDVTGYDNKNNISRRLST